jgi:hypothetical protein
MRHFNVTVIVVNPMYLVVLGSPPYIREQRVIFGYTLADAKRRAGIQ